MDKIILMVEILIFQLLVLVFSVIIHEVSHGYVAERLGDPTARLAGRLTLNPMAHFSFFGMIVFPILTYLAWGIPVGGAKPVPYNPNNLKNPRKGGAIIAVAGPLSNIVLAAVFGIILRLSSFYGLPQSFSDLLSVIIYINVLLAVFNLVPVPPLDGSKAINLLLSRRLGFYWESFWNKVMLLIRQNQLLFLILLIFLFRYVFAAVFFVIQPVIDWLFLLFAGGKPLGF